jgi:hypothetical protein
MHVEMKRFANNLLIVYLLTVLPARVPLYVVSAVL